MKKFDFSLGRILDYRQSMLDKEKNALMLLLAQRDAAELAIEEAKALYKQLAEARTEIAAAGTTVLELQQLELKLRGQKERIEALAKELDCLETAADQQRQVVTHASQEVKGLELLRDRQREEYAYALRKEEEERIGEMLSVGLIGTGQAAGLE